MLAPTGQFRATFSAVPYRVKVSHHHRDDWASNVKMMCAGANVPPAGNGVELEAASFPL